VTIPIGTCPNHSIEKVEQQTFPLNHLHTDLKSISLLSIMLSTMNFFHIQNVWIDLMYEVITVVQQFGTFPTSLADCNLYPKRTPEGLRAKLFKSR